MKNFFLSSITTPPKGNRSLAAQLGYCFAVIIVILIVISMTITSVYTKVLEQDRADALQTTAVISALAVSHVTLQEGMNFPLPVSIYLNNGQPTNYIINIYKNAGRSFLRVYTSEAKDPTATDQVTLDGASNSYLKAFDQQEAVVVTRTDKTGSFVAGVAPVIGSEGTVSGLVEVMMPVSDFSATQKGLSLSWIFTILSIAAALSIVYFEIHKLLTTMFGQPDRQLPKIIRYGLSGCQSIAFFSAMACSMPPLVISSYLLAASDAGKLPSFMPATLIILLAGLLFSLGFFGFNGLRQFFVRRFTTRISLIIAIFVSFVLLLVSSLFSNVYLYLVLLLPTGFSLGMVFYFQREYRIYASRLGYEEFSERIIHTTQYTGYLLGSCVGAVMAGIIYERFGLTAVSLICGSVLFIVGIQALLFVQHCPPSSSPPLHLPDFLYALLSKKSGTFIWSCIITAGIQVGFFFVFIPSFLHSVGLSLATISFYFILFSFVGSVLMRALLKLFPNTINMRGRIMLSSVLQTAGLLLLSFIPTTKVLVITVVLMGAALGLHEFRYPDYYKEMIREDKHAFAREILERGFAVGAVIGAIGYGALYFTDNLRLSLMLLTVIMIVMLFAYPLITLLYTSTHPDEPLHDSSEQDTQGPFEGYQDTIDYGSRQQDSGQPDNRMPDNRMQDNRMPDNRLPDGSQQDSGQIFYGQDRYNTYGRDNSEEGDNI